VNTANFGALNHSQLFRINHLAEASLRGLSQRANVVRFCAAGVGHDAC
jgi:hypothetical protein